MQRGSRHSGAGAGSYTERKPALMDQPADQRARDRLGHRPAWRRAIRRTERAVAFRQHTLRRGDQDAVDARWNWRTTHPAPRPVQPAAAPAVSTASPRGQARPASGGRRAMGAGSNAGRGARTEQDAAIAGTRDRRAGQRRAECGIPPAHGRAAVGVVGFDDDAAGAMRVGSSAWPPERRAVPSGRRESASARQRKCRSAVSRSRPLTNIMSA